MKSILLICNQNQIDTPLRRSLAHLVKSCQISIVRNGDDIFEELSLKAFDLIIIDFEISGSDSLELVESVQYIDPGVPVILMLQPAYATVAATARRFKANPIVRPFDALDFLRLVDKLLHQQLNRYRRLAEVLKNSLEQLRLSTEALCAFLADDGQILIASGEVGGLSLADLAGLLVEEPAGPAVFHISIDQARALFAYDQVDDYSLYTTAVAETLSLALLAPITADPLQTTATWNRVDQVAAAVRDMLHSSAPASLRSPDTAELPGETAPYHQLFPVTLRTDYTAPPAPDTPVTPPADEETTIAVNWSILATQSETLNRLQKFCQID